MKRSKKGFTLAELLVVVAIIAVLVAVAIPIYPTSTNKAEEAVEVANARAVYSEGMISVLNEEGNTITKTYGDKTYTFTYDEGAKEWSIAITTTDGTIYNSPYTNAENGTSFDNVVVDGTATYTAP